jgi:hypothetical protein
MGAIRRAASVPRAAVQDQLAPEHLDRARVARGMTVDEIDAAVDQPVRESGIPIPTPR